MRYFKILILVCILLCYNCVYADTARLLSDDELDEISAKGLEVNVEAVLALRQAIGVVQNNIAAISGLTNSSSTINNYNSASIQSFAGSVSSSQRNIAAVVATGGDINGAQINNTNYASVEAAGGDAGLNQSNVGALIALEGSITDSQINNLNRAVVNNPSGFSNISQYNIAITVAAGTIDAIINNINEIDVEGSAIINSGSDIIHTFSYGGFSGVIRINN